MRKENFEGIMSGLHEAIAHAKGQTNDLTIHELPDLDVAASARRRSSRRGTLHVLLASLSGRFKGGPSLPTWVRRRKPEGAARALLTFIDHDPISVVNTLTAARMGAKHSTARAERRPRHRRAG